MKYRIMRESSDNKMSITQLSKKIGLSIARLSNYELGDRTMPMPVKIAYIRLFKEDYKQEDINTLEDTLSSEEQALYDKIKTKLELEK